MRILTLALLLMFSVLLGVASADDSLYFYLPCTPGHPCIDMAHRDGKTKSVLAEPVQVLKGADVQSASIQGGVNAQQSLNLRLREEASRKFERVTGDNIGKNLMVVFDNKILTTPTIQAPIHGGILTIYSNEDPFWERAPWLQDLIERSHSKSGQSVTLYVVIVTAVLILVSVFLFLPRMRRNRESHSE